MDFSVAVCAFHLPMGCCPKNKDFNHPSAKNNKIKQINLFSVVSYFFKSETIMTASGLKQDPNI